MSQSRGPTAAIEKVEVATLTADRENDEPFDFALRVTRNNHLPLPDQFTKLLDRDDVVGILVKHAQQRVMDGISVFITGKARDCLWAFASQIAAKDAVINGVKPKARTGKQHVCGSRTLFGDPIHNHNGRPVQPL